MVWYTRCGPVWPTVSSVVQCGGCGKYSHKLFLNPRLPAATQQSACRELPPDTQVDSQGVDSGQWTVKGGVDKQVEIQGVDKQVDKQVDSPGVDMQVDSQIVGDTFQPWGGEDTLWEQ